MHDDKRYTVIVDDTGIWIRDRARGEVIGRNGRGGEPAPFAQRVDADAAAAMLTAHAGRYSKMLGHDGWWIFDSWQPFAAPIGASGQSGDRTPFADGEAAAAGARRLNDGWTAL